MMEKPLGAKGMLQVTNSNNGPDLSPCAFLHDERLSRRNISIWNIMRIGDFSTFIGRKPERFCISKALLTFLFC